MIETIPTIGIATMDDATWGRLYQFNTTGDAGLIMPFRSYYFRDFIVNDWNDLCIGLIFATCGNTGDTSDLIDERQSETAVDNLFHFGLSKSSGTTIDVINNPSFLGLRGIIGGITQIIHSTKTLAQLYLTQVKNGITRTEPTPLTLPLSEGISSNPFCMVGLRFVRNQANQLVYINWDTDNAVALPNDAANTTVLTNFLEGISNNFTDAIASFPLDSVTDLLTYYIYWPYLQNKLKLHAIGVIKIG